MICKVWLLYAKMNILGYKSCCRSLMVASRWVPNGRITRLKFNYSFVKCMSNTLLCANAVLSPWDRPVSHVSVTKMCIDWEGEVVRGQSVQFIHSVLCDSLRPHESQHARLSITNSQSLLKLMPIELVMPSSHLILCHPLLLLPTIPPRIRVFSNESILRMRWQKYWSFSFSISPSSEYPWLISFRVALDNK